jgi:hypothetical protein
LKVFFYIIVNIGNENEVEKGQKYEFINFLSDLWNEIFNSQLLIRLSQILVQIVKTVRYYFWKKDELDKIN